MFYKITVEYWGGFALSFRLRAGFLWAWNEEGFAAKHWVASWLTIGLRRNGLLHKRCVASSVSLSSMETSYFLSRISVLLVATRGRTFVSPTREHRMHSVGCDVVLQTIVAAMLHYVMRGCILPFSSTITLLFLAEKVGNVVFWFLL